MTGIDIETVDGHHLVRLRVGDELALGALYEPVTGWGRGDDDVDVKQIGSFPFLNGLTCRHIDLQGEQERLNLAPMSISDKVFVDSPPMIDVKNRLC